MSAWPGRDDDQAFLPPAKPCSTASTRERTEEVSRLRVEEGLPGDPESVQRAITNSNRPGYPWNGLRYTVEEEADLAAVKDDLPQRAEAVFADAPDALADVSWAWRDSRRVLHVAVTRDVERFRELLEAALGAERVLVSTGEFALRDLETLEDRIAEEIDHLEELGVDVESVGADAHNRVEIEYFAPDRITADRLLGSRYGPAVTPTWLAPARLGEEPHPFASWIAEGPNLTVFYALDHNGEQPCACTTEEKTDRVIVRLTILAPQGSTTLIGGYKPAHATLTLGHRSATASSSTGQPAISAPNGLVAQTLTLRPKPKHPAARFPNVPLAP